MSKQYSSHQNQIPNNSNANQLLNYTGHALVQNIKHNHTASAANTNDAATANALNTLASTLLSTLSALPTSMQNQIFFQIFSQQQLNNSIKPSQSLHERAIDHKLKNIQTTNTISKETHENDSTTEQNDKSSIILRNPDSKYPLECEWCFWFFKNNKTADWKDNLMLITTVDNVEDFWSVFSYLKPAKFLQDGRDYMFFKKGIRPMWEDAHNRDGGRWLVNISRDLRQSTLDQLWMNTLLSLIGSQYDKESSLINGAVVNVRFRCDKLSLWTKSYENEESQKRIGKKFKKVIGAQEGMLMFELHEKFDTCSDSAKSLEQLKHVDTSTISENSSIDLKEFISEPEVNTNELDAKDKNSDFLNNTKQANFYQRIKYTI